MTSAIKSRNRKVVPDRNEQGAQEDALTTVTIVAHHVGGIGGMDRQLEQLVLRLADMGHQVRVIARRCELQPRSQVKWIRVWGPARPFALAFPWFFALAAVAVARHRSGVVHVSGAIIPNRAHIATVHLCHRALPRSASSHRASRRSIMHTLNGVAARWLSRWAERWCYRPARVEQLVTVSRGAAEELKRCFPSLAKRTTVIPNAVDHEEFRPDPDDGREPFPEDLEPDRDRLTALFVGGDWQRKGLRFAIEAVARQSRWQLVVIGDGDRTRYEEHAASLGARDRVRFVSSSRDVVPLYQMADAFICPSAYETFSLATHEAAACGLPLLATRVSGIEDLLENGVNGWFVHADGEDIAHRLEALASDPSLRRAMGAAAREASQRYSWDAVAREYSDLYRGFAETPTTHEATRVEVRT